MTVTDDRSAFYKNTKVAGFDQGSDQGRTPWRRPMSKSTTTVELSSPLRLRSGQIVGNRIAKAAMEDAMRELQHRPAGEETSATPT